MKVLVACEESQTVCKAFRELGHEAYSCDIQECSGGHPEWHILGDALMKWDLDSPVTFKAEGHTVHDFDRRFAMEDMGLIPTDRTFRWEMLDKQPKFRPWNFEQLSLF